MKHALACCDGARSTPLLSQSPDGRIIQYGYPDIAAGTEAHWIGRGPARPVADEFYLAIASITTMAADLA